MKPRNRLQIIKDEIDESTEMICSLLVERDIAAILHQDPLSPVVQGYNKEINSLITRKEILNQLLVEEESPKE